jgi:hypothetical protein
MVVEEDRVNVEVEVDKVSDECLPEVVADGQLVHCMARV